MTELEIMQRAKNYLDKLAQGIDPLTDREVSEDDIINNVRISRCLFYAADILRQVIENGGIQAKTSRRGEIVPAMPFAAMKPLGAGDTFDLGGLHIETLACPGHTPGPLAFLLAEERMLFLGDAANGRTFLFDEFAAPIPAYRETLRALDAQAAGRYDRILLSHAGGEVKSGLLPSLIAVCDDILAGRAENQPFEFLGETAYLAKAIGSDGERADGGEGNIVYRRA